MPSSSLTAHSFRYEECDVPLDMTLAVWRREQDPPAPRRWWTRLRPAR